MQAALAATAAPKGPQRRPGWAGWLLVAPMILWLAAFVVVPTSILLVYSFGERGSDEPVDLVFTWQNYARVFAGTEVWPLARCVLQSAGIAVAVIALAWFKLSDDAEERRATARTIGFTIFGVVLLWNVWAHLETVFTGTYVRIFVRSLYYAGATTAMCVVVG